MSVGDHFLFVESEADLSGLSGLVGIFAVAAIGQRFE